LHAKSLEDSIDETIKKDFSKGVWVDAGQVVAFVGNHAKCASIGNHLHFELRKGLEEVVDPYVGPWWIAP
jgi:murein DD-endopeptidase MepM/ murein hydrolase activator NlpD